MRIGCKANGLDYSMQFTNASSRIFSLVQMINQWLFVLDFLTGSLMVDTDIDIGYRFFVSFHWMEVENQNFLSKSATIMSTTEENNSHLDSKEATRIDVKNPSVSKFISTVQEFAPVYLLFRMIKNKRSSSMNFISRLICVVASSVDKVFMSIIFVKRRKSISLFVMMLFPMKNRWLRYMVSWIRCQKLIPQSICLRSSNWYRTGDRINCQTFSFVTLSPSCFQAN